jgi:hypothetical protein
MGSPDRVTGAFSAPSKTGVTKMLRALVLAATVAIASPAIAAECRPTETVLLHLAALKATHATYDGDAVKRAGLIYASLPPAGAQPEADHLIVAELPTGSVMLLFLHGDNVCATMMIPDTRTAALAKIFILGIEV